MIKKLPYVLLALIPIAAVAITWQFMGSTAEGAPDGYPLVCPHCDHFFTLDQEGLISHPKGSAGEGFKCPECGQFGARIAAKCDQCSQWVLLQEGPGGSTYCPKCPRPQPAQP